VNESSITFVAPTGNATEIGGNTVTATVEAHDVRGDPVAAGTPIAFEIATTNDATLSADTVNADAQGRATVTITTSAVPDDTREDLVITASFLALAGSDEPLSASVTVSLNPVGTLLLNATADPLEVHSDGATITDRTSTITVTFTKDDDPVNPADVTLSIPVASRSRITFAGGAFSVALDEGDFDSEGSAEVDVVAVAGVAPGQVTIDVTGTDGVKNADPTAVTLEVLREPVLQSIVFISAAPSPIGVRGGTLPTSTVVEFELRDDQNAVMANVPVTFATPPTADPGIALLGSDVSGPDGKVQTVLSSGTIAAPVVVAVTATPANGPPLTAFSEPVAIIGGLPNFASSFMTCGDSFAHVEGEAFECQATLVDRFSNLAGGQVVQFRAEGSGTTAFATSDDSGVAAAALVLDDGDTESGTSVSNWSYGFVPTVSDVPALYAGCFDNTVTTGCDLLQLCEDEPFFCPLEPNCLDDALTARSILESNLTVSDLQGAAGRQELATYVATHRSCGFPVSCLIGADFNDPLRQGLISSVLVGDECAAATGCFDYDASECPADGILTVTASTRGEESFTDGNGNGVFDFIDSNDNGHQDTNEMPISGQTCDATVFPTVCRPERCQNGVCEVTFGSCVDDGDCVGGTAIDVPVDLPEPFLDKNDSCAFDDFSGSPRFLHTPSQRLKHSDLFNDVDNNNIFGFGTPAEELNGLWDPDTEIFLSAHVLSVGAARIQVGAPCDVAAGACPIEAQTPSGVIGMDPGGIPASISNGQTITLRYRATDVNGNCPNPGFEDKLTAITLAGLKLAGDLTVTMQPLDCGYAFGINPVKSFCEDYSALGSPVGTLQLTGDCETEPLQGTLDLKIGDENTAITIQCTP
jgi:hypothetical protein